EDLADLDARDVRVDRAELPADLARGVHLEVPHVLVGRSTTEEDIDDRLVRRRRAGAGLGPEHVGQRQRGGAEGERPDLEEAAAGDAVAVAPLLAPNREHGQVTPFVRVAGPGGRRLAPSGSTRLGGGGQGGWGANRLSASTLVFGRSEVKYLTAEAA